MVAAGATAAAAGAAVLVFDFLRRSVDAIAKAAAPVATTVTSVEESNGFIVSEITKVGE